jgi:hypothetical protein
MDYTWYPAYRSALLETDKPKIRARLLIAEEKIVARLRVLSQDHGGTTEERLAIAKALSGIKGLRTEVTDWKVENDA